ncbi:hypothetical protein CCP2SC5_880006 [Azospirillaceae bacterium]
MSVGSFFPSIPAADLILVNSSSVSRMGGGPDFSRPAMGSVRLSTFVAPMIFAASLAASVFSLADDPALSIIPSSVSSNLRSKSFFSSRNSAKARLSAFFSGLILGMIIARK